MGKNRKVRRGRIRVNVVYNPARCRVPKQSASRIVFQRSAGRGGGVEVEVAITAKVVSEYGRVGGEPRDFAAQVGVGGLTHGIRRWGVGEEGRASKVVELSTR